MFRSLRLPVLLCTLSLVLVPLAGPAGAQALEPSGKIVSFGLAGGLTVPVADSKHAFDNGVNGQGFVRLNLPVFPIQPRFDFTFQKFDLKDVAFAAPDFGDAGTASISDNATKLTVNGGAGLNVKLGPVSGYIEGRINNIMNDGELIDFDSVQLVPVSLGVVF